MFEVVFITAIVLWFIYFTFKLILDTRHYVAEYERIKIENQKLYDEAINYIKKTSISYQINKLVKK